MCQFLEAGQSGRHWTAGDSAGKASVKPWDAENGSKGPRCQQHGNRLGASTSARHQAEGPSVSFLSLTRLKLRMSVQVRDGQELPRNNDQSIHSRISRLHCMQELSHSFRVQARRLRFQSRNPQDDSKEY